MTMEQIFKDRNNRLVLIGLFLGMLELIRLHLIWIEQPEPLGSIHVRALTNEPAEQAVPKAIYAAEAESAHDQSPLIESDAASVVAAPETDEEEDLQEELNFNDDLTTEITEIITPIDTTAPAILPAPGEETHPRIPIVELPAQQAKSVVPNPDISCPSTPSDESPA
jgi:hypothetical protein